MHPGIHRTLSSCLLKSYERHIFLRQNYLYQVQRVKTLWFTLRPSASPFLFHYTPDKKHMQAFYFKCIKLPVSGYAILYT